MTAECNRSSLAASVERSNTQRAQSCKALPAIPTLGSPTNVLLGTPFDQTIRGRLQKASPSQHMLLHPMYQHHNVYHPLFWMCMSAKVYSLLFLWLGQFFDYLTPQSNYCNQESITHPKTPRHSYILIS